MPCSTPPKKTNQHSHPPCVVEVGFEPKETKLQCSFQLFTFIFQFSNGVVFDLQKSF